MNLKKRLALGENVHLQRWLAFSAVLCGISLAIYNGKWIAAVPACDRVCTRNDSTRDIHCGNRLCTCQSDGGAAVWMQVLTARYPGKKWKLGCGYDRTGSAKSALGRNAGKLQNNAYLKT